MKKNKIEILRKHINSVQLVSTTSQNWYDSNGDLVPWDNGDIYIGPQTGDTIFNTLDETYYTWSGSSWVSGSKEEVYPSYNLPVFLDSTIDEMGVMVGFDGDIEQIEQLCNFTYTQTGSTIQVYNSINPDKLRKIIEQTYTIEWGDGSISGLTVNEGVQGTQLPTISHTYSTIGDYVITIKLDSPWTTQKLNKKITIPQNITIPDPLGTYTYTGDNLPYFNVTGEFYLQNGRTQNYLNDLETNPITGTTTFTYLGIGGSRIEEKRLYGSTSYSGVTYGTDDNGNYSEYSFVYTGNTTGTTLMYYRDYEDGTTLITGNTTGYTQEEIINEMITRNEHFLGFVEDPTIYSDIFVERGKQGVMEKSFRLGEIDNMGELSIYGNGYFKVKKQ